QSRLEVALQLRQVEIRASALAQQGCSIVKKEQAKIEQRPRDWLTFHQKVLFVEVPSARPYHQRGQIGPKPILFSIRTLVSDGSPNRVAQIVLAFDIVVPGGRIRVLEIGHENTGTRVQRVDDHLAIDRAGNFHATVEEILRNRRHFPLPLADSDRFRQKVRRYAMID